MLCTCVNVAVHVLIQSYLRSPIQTMQSIVAAARLAERLYVRGTALKTVQDPPEQRAAYRDTVKLVWRFR